MSDDVKLDDHRLKAFINALSQNLNSIKVGVAESKDSRKSGTQTNSKIGIKHEFGQDGMPVRSFLRVPIMEHLQKYLDKNGAFNPEMLKKIVAEGRLTEWAKKVAATCEEVVQDAFASGGFGKWPESNMVHKTNKQTLVETQQLRNSITSEVK